MITQKIEKTSEIKSWPGEIPVHNLYTVGVAGERFLRAIKEEGKLLATVCEGCRKDFLPPKIFCPFCLSELSQWKEIPPQGRVETFTVSRLDISGAPLKEPQIFAFIRLASAGGLIHRLGGIAPDKVKIGLKVQAVFKPSAERTGSLLDIDSFRPV
jgi:uncharacterized OB-fold protein